MRDATTGTEYYYVPQDMHSVSALADASGHVVESYRYDVYGKVTMTDSHGQPIEQSAVGNPYFFTGRWLDFYSDSAGRLKQFYDYRARTYDPENGRFLQRDPKGYVDGGNLYEAFRGNPARFTDPYGQETYADTTQRRVILDGVDVIEVQYWIVHTGANLGLGAQLFLAWNAVFGSVPNEEIANREYAGMEYYAYTDDPKLQKHMDVQIENTRWIVEECYLANRDVANFRQGIIVLGTTGVALPVSAATAPVVTAATGTSLVGLTASGMITGGVSLGGGRAVGHTLAGDSASEIVAATVEGTAYGMALGGVFGAASRFDMSLTGPNAFTLTHGPLGARAGALGVLEQGSTSTALGRFDALDRLAGAAQIRSAAPVGTVASGAERQLLFSFVDKVPASIGTGASSGLVPRGYSVALEVRLKPAQFGLGRPWHFQIANEALAAERASNAALARLVPAPTRWGQPPTGWRWHHAAAVQAGGRPGALHLVPRTQHTPGSPFWRVLHPLPYGGGGYTEWAIPAGAPLK